MQLPEYIEYADYYDYDTAHLNDYPFWESLAKECGSPILELACGTGRLLIPLLKAGFTVHGLDLSEQMLAGCYAKLDAEGLSDRTEIYHVDMATFDLPRKDYSLIYVAFRSFMHLYSQEAQLSCIKRVKAHLKPGGRFAVDVYAPCYRMLAQEDNQPWFDANKFHLDNGNRVQRQDRHVRNDPKPQFQHSELKYEEFDVNDNMVRTFVVPIVTRYTFRYELQLLLEKAGFAVEAIYRDFERNPYDGTGEIIAVARV